ncbi:MAG: DUF1289 domain-containing protein [Beijerinckiaceae bacterium]
MAGVSSPCVKICVLDPAAGICLGCGRTMAEISGWLRMSETDRAAVKRQLGQRLRSMRGKAT